jgi:hypothetical protein
MPIITWNDIKNYRVIKISTCESNLLNKLVDKIIIVNRILSNLIEIKNNLIRLLIK